MTKRCKGCEDIKSVEQFWKAKKTRDRLQPFCKSCQAILNAAWQWDNRKRRQAERKARYLRDRAKERANYAEWRKANPEKYRRAIDRWNDNNPARRLNNVRVWQANNPERVRVIHHRASTNRRARKRAAFVEHVDPQRVYARDGGICQICHKPVEPNHFHVDHVVPLAKGGEHSYANVQLAHPRCNLTKGTKYGCAA